MRFEDVMKESADTALLEWNDSPGLPANPGMPSTDYILLTRTCSRFFPLGSRDAAGSEATSGNW